MKDRILKLCNLERVLPTSLTDVLIPFHFKAFKFYEKKNQKDANNNAQAPKSC
jgi:hypothetical protein